MNLVPLFEEAIEFQNYNGSVLSNGKVAVFYIGRTRLADIFNDIEGLSPAENPKVLDNLGMGPLYVNPAFDYEIIVYDAYDNEMFSVKKYLHSKGEHSTANVVVTPSENIAVSAWTIGDVQVYMPYLTGDIGKTYEGIDPIVVNNEYNRISANHIPLGVQDPLYFVEDSESACIIGCSAQTEIPSALSSKWNEASDAVIANSAQWAEGTEYEAGSYVNIDGHTINVTGLQPEGDYAYNSALSSALSSKLDITALPQDLVHSGDLTAYQPAGDYQTAGNYLSATDSAKFYPNNNPSGFITGVDLTGYATTAQLDEKLDKADSGNFYPMEGNPSGFLTAHQSLQGYATEQWVEGKGYLTSVDIPESANWNGATTVVNNNSAIWNNTTNIVSANSAQWASSTANPQIPVTGINGIKISESGDQVVFEVSADYAVADDLTGKQDSLTFGYKDTAISSIDNSALYDNSAHARITTLAGRISNLSSNKLETSAFSDVSGSFLTAVPDTYLQNTDLTITDGKVTEISGVPLSAGGELPEGVSAATDYVTANSAAINGTVETVSANSGSWVGSALPISAGHGIKFEIVNDTLVASVTSTSTSGYVWQSASLFYTDTPIKQTTYTLSDNCSNYDRLDVDFYDINNWRTVMECPIPSNLDASGTRGGYFSVVPASTATAANIWFKAFNWTASGTTWSCYCSELAGQGGSTTQHINANQPDNPPRVIQIIGWKRVEV